jgi:hypothetical protein
VLFAALLVLGWATARRSGDAALVAGALWAGVGTVLAVVINQPIVNAVHEPRPYTSPHTLLVLADHSHDFSFPSGHATMAGAVAAGLFSVRARLGAIATVAAGLIAFARVYIAAHYPQDVLAGLMLGAAVAGIGWALLRGVLTRAVTMLARTRLRPMITMAPVAPVPSAVCGIQRDWAQFFADAPAARPRRGSPTGPAADRRPPGSSSLPRTDPSALRSGLRSAVHNLMTGIDHAP